MNNKKEIIKKIEAVGLKVETKLTGFHVYPLEEDDSCMWGTNLNKLIAIAQEYNLSYYIDFELGCVRLH